MKLMERFYDIYKDGERMDEEVSIIIPLVRKSNFSMTNSINNAFRELKKKYPESDGYWLVHTDDIFHDPKWFN